MKNTFNIVLKKSEELEEAFVGFLNGIKISVGTFLDTVAYAFLIPIITDIQHYISTSSDPRETGKIILERLVASGLVVMGAETLSALITKLIRKFK